MATTPPTKPVAADRGSAAVEFALAVPMLLLILLTITQLAAWGLGHLTAQTAADRAVNTTRVTGGTTAAGRTAAAQLLDQVGVGLISDRHISVARGRAVTTVTVRGHCPGVPLPIDVTATAPTERYTSP